jgi:quercetin dioxygenase-like cupin family protein
MSILLAVSLLGLARAAEPAVRHQNEMEWKVSGTLPQGLATHDYHLVYEDPGTHGIVTLVRFSKGYSLPAHGHSHDEVILVLKGKLEIALPGKTSSIGPGEYATIPAGTPHALKVLGWSGCELLVHVTGPIDFKPASL